MSKSHDMIDGIEYTSSFSGSLQSASSYDIILHTPMTLLLCRSCKCMQ